MNKATLFIDESGKASLVEGESKFLLTGVILEDKEISNIEGFFNYIKRKYGIATDAPFHSYDIFEKPGTRLSNDKAVHLVRSLADFISLIPASVHTVAIDKEKFKKALGVQSAEDFKGDARKKELRNYPYQVAASYIFAKYAKFLSSNNLAGSIIADSRKGGDSQLIKTLDNCKEKDGPLNDSFTELVKERVFAICFANKNFLSGGLELTDLISFVTYFNVRRTMNTMANIQLEILWGEIKKKLSEGEVTEIDEEGVRKYFKIKKGEVHKHLQIS